MKRKNKKIIAAVIATALAALAFSGCGSGEKTENNSGNNTPSVTEKTENTNTPSPEPEDEKGDFTMTPDHVKLIGRTFDAGDVLWFSYSGSGVEFKFTGKTCDIMVRADSIVNQKQHAPRFAVYVDGERVLERVMEQGIERHNIITSDAVEEHIVHVVKLSETSDSTMGIYPLICDDEAKIEPTPEKELKIEFVGDSITCGYGVDGKLGEVYSTSNEDCTKAYAYRTAEKLNADYSLVSKSGHGIISGYTANGVKQPEQLVKNYYTKFGDSYGTFNKGTKPVDIEWDFSKFVPDIIVINLGTNDASYTRGDGVRCEEYVQGYLEFLTMVREKNPDAKIVCVLGLMGQELYPSVEETVNRFREDNNDENVYCFKLDVQGSEVVVDYHPTAASHDHASDQMVEFLTPLINK